MNVSPSVLAGSKSNALPAAPRVSAKRTAKLTSKAKALAVSKTTPTKRRGRPPKKLAVKLVKMTPAPAPAPASQRKRRGRPPSSSKVPPKKRGRKPAAIKSAALGVLAELATTPTRRGRPPKSPAPAPTPTPTPTPKRRGRPPKHAGKSMGRPRKNAKKTPGRKPKKTPTQTTPKRAARQPAYVEEDEFSALASDSDDAATEEIGTPATVLNPGRKSRGAARGALAAVSPQKPSTPAGRIPIVDYMGIDLVTDTTEMDAVVKVFCTHTEPNYSLPWQRKRQSASTSSGFIIRGRRILTNAHSVEHHTSVKLKKRGGDKKYEARVLAIGVECDLALLTVDDDEFFAGTTPIDFGQLPSLQAAVTVVGYPIGGVAISVTSGVVSRIEVTSYSHGSSELLGLQIDAAINSGNSGGPAFNAQGGCVGVAFQSLKADDAENIGYVIPTPVIMHFIRDYEKNGKYTGFPTLPATWQKLENPNMRKFLKMTPAQKGVMVRRVDPVSPGSNKLKNGDVLLSFDGVEIANDGTVPFRTGERISFHYLVTEKFVGEKARVTFLRDGTTHAVDLPLTQVPRLVPVHIEGVPPSFYIAAGLVFTTVCVPYLKSEYGKDYDYDAPVPILNRMMYDQVTDKGQNVVVVAHVLSAPINIGYEDIVNTVVNGFNGKPVSNLKQLADMCDGCKDPFMRFELDHNLLVVLKTKEAHGATQDILKTHCIPSAKSQDLK